MTQIVRWITQTIASLTRPREMDLPPEVKVTIGDAKRINEVIAPSIQEYLLRQGYDESMAGCGWRADTFCVVVTFSRPPKEDEIIEIANMAVPFPLAIEVAPDLRETCEDIIRAATALGLKVEVTDCLITPQSLPGRSGESIRRLLPSPKVDGFDSAQD